MSKNKTATLAYRATRNTGVYLDDSEHMQVKQQVYIHRDLLIFSNPMTCDAVVDAIASDLRPEMFGAVPVFKLPNGYILTDGNHRVRGAMKKGEVWIPCVILSKKEFEYIKYSLRTLDFVVEVPNKKVFIERL